MSTWQHIKLRDRLILIVVGAMTSIVLVTSAFLIVSHQRAMVAQFDMQTRMMREELGNKGQAIAVAVAQASERALATDDYLFLSQVMETTKGTDKQFVYGALTNQQNVAIIHTNSQAAGKGWVDDPVTSGSGHLRDITYDGKQIIEAVAPLRVADSLWGAVRFGLSLDALHAAIEERQQTLSAQLSQSILTSLAVTLALVALGVALAVGSANSLLSPMRKLMEGVHYLREGHLEFTVLASGSPEFVELAQGFNDMTLAVRHREKALQEALKEADDANRYKGEFLANVSHELRTPLNALLNVPAALLEDYQMVPVWVCPQCNARFDPDPETWGQPDPHEDCPDCQVPMTMTEEVTCVGTAAEHKHLNERALRNAQHLLRLVNDVLDFSRLQAHKLDLHIERVDPITLLNDVTESLQGLAKARGQRMSSQVEANLTSLALDRVRITQVLINLMGNAIKFSPEGSEIRIRLSPDVRLGKEYVLIAVADNGIGIREDKLSVIFEPFRQADGSHTRAYEGTGLGLAIVKQIVDLHGGHVWAESAVGKGSTFFVLLPRLPPNAESGAGLKRQEAASRRVLIIDDDGVYLETGQALLRRVGFTVDILRDPADTVEVVGKVRPDLVIMDVMMPKMSGFDVLRALRAGERTRDVPVLVSSGYLANEAVASSLGAMWLPKPWQAQDLMEILQKNHILEDLPPPREES